MATGIEYTQSFTTTFVSSGLNTFFWTLDAASPSSGSKFIIKSVYVSISNGYTSSISGTYLPTVVLMTSATAGSVGSNIEVVTSLNTGTSSSLLSILNPVNANNTTPAASLTNQFISSQSCLGVTLNATNASAVVNMVVIYSVIDGLSPLIDNFQSFYDTIVSGVNLTFPASSTNTRILKSSIVTITGSASELLTVTPVALSNPSSAIQCNLTDPFALIPYKSFCYSDPFYMNPNSLTEFGFDIVISGSGNTLTYYTSWTEDIP